MFVIIILVLGYYGLGIAVRWMAKHEIYYCFVPGGTTAYLVGKANKKQKSADPTKSTPPSGGGIVGILHDIPGHKVDRRSRNALEWKIVKGFELRNLFYYLYNVQKKGWFKDLRINTVREFRSTMKKDAVNANSVVTQPQYEITMHEYETPFVYFSREHAIVILGSETAGAYELDITSTLTYDEVFPVRARLEVADANAFLSKLVSMEVSSQTGSQEPEYYVFGVKTPGTASNDSVKKRRDDLAAEVEKALRQPALESIGFRVKKFVVDSVEMDAETRRLLELQETTKREMAAEVQKATQEVLVAEQHALGVEATARGASNAKLLDYAAEAKLVETVLAPMAKDDRTVAVWKAKMYRDNTTVTVYAPGDGDAILPMHKTA